MHQVASSTDKGRHRAINEDSILCLRTENFYMVADGVGGHNSGELASKLATELIEAYIKTHPIISITDESALKNYFLNSLLEVNASILEQAHRIPENLGMATTVVLAYIAFGKAYVVNIGDSRAYLIRDGNMLQITEDHSYVNTLLKQGIITQEEAVNHPKRNLITKALGSEEKVEPDFYMFKIYEGDRILLCSDGLYNEIEEKEMSTLAQQAVSIEVMVQELVRRANEYGGRDNISVICIEIQKQEKEIDHE